MQRACWYGVTELSGTRDKGRATRDGHTPGFIDAFGVPWKVNHKPGVEDSGAEDFWRKYYVCPVEDLHVLPSWCWARKLHTFTYLPSRQVPILLAIVQPINVCIGGVLVTLVGHADRAAPLCHYEIGRDSQLPGSF